MSSNLLMSTLVCPKGRVWYAALSGRTTLDISARNLSRFDRRVREERLRALIIDYRRVQLIQRPGEMVELAKRFVWKLPPCFAVAYVTGKSTLKQAGLMVKLLRSHKVPAAAFGDWHDAADFAGVCTGTTDPLDRGVLELP